MDYFRDRMKEMSTWGGLASLAFTFFGGGAHFDGSMVPQLLTSIGLIFAKEHKE